MYLVDLYLQSTQVEPTYLRDVSLCLEFREIWSEKFACDIKTLNRATQRTSFGNTQYKDNIIINY